MVKNSLDTGLEMFCSAILLTNYLDTKIFSNKDLQFSSYGLKADLKSQSISSL